MSPFLVFQTAQADELSNAANFQDPSQLRDNILNGERHYINSCSGEATLISNFRCFEFLLLPKYGKKSLKFFPDYELTPDFVFSNELTIDEVVVAFPLPHDRLHFFDLKCS